MLQKTILLNLEMKFFSCQKHPPRPISLLSHKPIIILILLSIITTLSSIILTFSIYVAASPLSEVSNGRQDFDPSNNRPQGFSNGQTSQQSSKPQKPPQPNDQFGLMNRPTTSLTLDPANQARREKILNSNQANPQNYSSPPQNFNQSATKPPDIPVSLVETGSGNGPIRVPNSDKFDDTEAGDDEHDEDYDYKETGSGDGNDFSAPKKIDSLVSKGTNSEIKKPYFDETEYYRPFRQPSVVGNVTIAPTTESTAKKFVEPPTTEAPKIMTTFKMFEKNQTPPNSNTDRPLSNIDNQVISKLPTTTTTTTTLMVQNSSSYIPEATTKLKLPSTNAAITISPLNINDNQMRVPNTTLQRPVIVPTRLPSYNPNNGSSLFKANTSRIDVDYDYDEDDNEDDESDDVSNFEDNDPVENSMINRTFVANSQIPLTVTSKPTTTIRPNTLAPFLTTPKNITNVAKPPSIPEAITQPSLVVRLPTSKENFVTTVRPSATSSPSITAGSSDAGNNGDEEEGEEDEDDEEEEDEIEDAIDGDPEDELDDNRGSEYASPTEINSTPSMLPPIFSSSSSRWTTLPPKLPTISTVVNNEVSKPKTTDSPTLESPSNPRSSYTEIQQKNRQDTTNILQVKDVSIVTMPSVMNYPSPSPTLISIITPPPAIQSTSADPRPSHTTVRSVSIKYMTTPWGGVTPIFIKPPSISAYDKSSQDDDTGLTKQIYDKAFEIYEVASKAVNATVEAVWPPSFELNANTFEPLLAQPLLFMCEYTIDLITSSYRQATNFLPLIHSPKRQWF